MNEIIFLVEEAPKADSRPERLANRSSWKRTTSLRWKAMRADAVRCHFEANEMPHVVRLHFTREQVIAV